MSEYSRRAVLATGAAALAGLAGCSGASGGGQNSTPGDTPTDPTATTTDGDTPRGTTTVRSRIQRLEARVAELEAELETREQRIAELESALETRDERIAELESALADERTRLEKLRDRLETRNERLSTLESELEDREKRIDELEAAVSEARTFSADVRRQALESGRQARPSVAFLRADVDNGFVTGTGWFVEEDLIVTNGHVVARNDEFTCWLPEGDSFTASVLASNHGEYGDVGHVDVGLLRAERTATPLTPGQSDALSDGQPVVQVGHPHFVEPWTISAGRYAGTDPYFGFLSTVPTSGGSSGSPVLTLDGEVVGLTGGETDDESGGSSPGERPTVGADTVYESFTDESYATHNPIGTVLDFVKEHS